MRKFQKSSLERIKLWLDIPFYMQYLESEEELDELILGCGLQEDDVKDSIGNSTTDLGSIHPGKIIEIDWHHTSIKYERDTGGNTTAKNVTEYHYSTPLKRCVSLIRAMINKRNPELARYGYTIYTTYDNIGDFYVRLDNNYSLYINFHAYMSGDLDTVRAGIYTGIDNITSCTKKLTKKKEAAALKKLKASVVYKKVLKL